MQRPLGVTILAVISLLVGLWELLVGLTLLGLGGVFAALMGTAFPIAGAVVGVLAVAIGVTAVVVAVFNLGFSYGAWHLRPWAWTLGFSTQIASLIWTGLVVLGPGTLRGHAGGLLLSAVLLYYLTTPEVKRAFGKA